MEQFRDIAAVAFALSLIGFFAVVMYFGIRHIIRSLSEIKSVSQYKKDTETDIAAYRAKVKELELKSQSTEVHA